MVFIMSSRVSFLTLDVMCGGRMDRRTEYVFLKYRMPCRSPNFCLADSHFDADGLCTQHCSVGLRITEDMIRYASNDALTVDRIMKLYREADLHFVECHGTAPWVSTHKGNGVYQGQFAFTLTKSPNDELTEEDMVKAVRKVMSQKSCPVVKYAWFLEHGDKETKSHPHIHGMYETATLGRIENKHWKRAWKIWDESDPKGHGFRGGYHRPVRSEEAYSDYIKKDGGLNEYLVG